MRTFPDIRMRQLVALGAEARAAFEKRDYKVALEGFQALERRLSASGLSSVFVQWALAVCHDSLGEPETAFPIIQRVLALDPFTPSHQSSFEIIARRVRAALQTLEASSDDIPRLYGVLQRAGEADVASHVAMARHFMATKRAEHAARLLEAVTMTAPASRDAWTERARVARVLGDIVTAAECEAEARAREAADVPWNFPGATQRQA